MLSNGVNPKVRLVWDADGGCRKQLNSNTEKVDFDTQGLYFCNQILKISFDNGPIKNIIIVSAYMLLPEQKPGDWFHRED